MKVLPIGYPLGFLPTGEYEIELFSQSNVHLTSKELELWISIFMSKTNEYRPEQYKTLIQKGVVLQCENENELIKCLSPLNTMRSGTGWFAQNKICITTDEDVFFTTKTQFDFWKKSDGHKTVEQVLSETAENVSFYDDITYLVINGLIILR